MDGLLRFSALIDRVLGVIARVGGWCAVLLVFVVCYDVITRYFGVPKPFGLNSTQIQESEYWLHSFLIVLTIGYAYTRQAHVRIDLVRETRTLRTRFWIETIGILVFLIPYAALGLWLAWPYAAVSFAQGEVSKSQIGLTNIWLLKGSLVVLYLLLLFAAISQLIKSVAGLTHDLPERMVSETLGGDL